MLSSILAAILVDFSRGGIIGYSTDFLGVLGSDLVVEGALGVFTFDFLADFFADFLADFLADFFDDFFADGILTVEIFGDIVGVSFFADIVGEVDSALIPVFSFF